MEDFVRTKTHLSTTENLSTTDTQHTLTTIRNHWNKAIAGLEQLALNNETAEAQPSTKNYTIHRHTMHTHCTFNTEQPQNKSNGRTRAPSPYGTTALQKELHITDTQYIHCTYDTKEPSNQSHGRTREPSP